MIGNEQQQTPSPMVETLQQKIDELANGILDYTGSIEIERRQSNNNCKK